MVEVIACPIWGTPAHLVSGSLEAGVRVLSPRAGGLYRISREALEDYPRLNILEMVTLTTWIVDQSRMGIADPELTTEAIAAILTGTYRPLSFAQRRERFFRCLINFQMRAGETVAIMVQPAMQPDDRRHPSYLSAWTGVLTDAEGYGLATMLTEQGFLTHAPGGLTLSAKGFEYLDTLEHAGGYTRQAFVAMWFADEMKEAWRLGFAPAIRDGGYDPFRIDNLEHNGKIDDAIVAEIKKSRFLIADFTCGVHSVTGTPKAEPRGGVYYEAGLAHGLGMEVIFTCRADRMDFLHFDTRQFAHIVWTTPHELRLQLYNRIAATVKEAPGAPGRGRGAVDPPSSGNKE